MTSPNNIPEGNTLEDQEVFLNLSKEEQDTEIERKHNIANILNGPKTIEIAGYKILGMPLESMGFTPEQQKKFEEAGGLMNPSVEVATAAENQDKMMYWTESFETLQEKIVEKVYEGFDLFKKVYEAFPDIRSMTKDEATEAGLYPTIHYRNFAARKWMAEMNGGHLARLDDNPPGDYWDFYGELGDIYNATSGETEFERLATIGQAPFGVRYADKSENSLGLGNWIFLASGTTRPNNIDYDCIGFWHIDPNSEVPWCDDCEEMDGMVVYNSNFSSSTDHEPIYDWAAVSSVVVLDK